jgi:hypothetical protein
LRVNPEVDRNSAGAIQAGAAHFVLAPVALARSLVALVTKPGRQQLFSAIRRAAFLGFSPRKALVWPGIVKGFSTSPLMLLILLMTNNRALMVGSGNSPLTSVLGWITVIAIFSASVGLVATWFI